MHAHEYYTQEMIQVSESCSSTNDISPLLCFHFWEPVYYKFDDSDFPSDSHEKRGHFVGISKSVGHAMTFKILTDDTLKVIHQSNVRLALNLHAKNLQLDPLEPGNVAMPIVKSRQMMGRFYLLCLSLTPQNLSDFTSNACH
jgi:hypothetical protein